MRSSAGIWIRQRPTLRRWHPCGADDAAGGIVSAGAAATGFIQRTRWIYTSTGQATDRFQYGYDRDGNVLYKNNILSSAHSELYHADGASAGYDLLNRLAAFQRGTLSDSNADGIPDTVASEHRSQSWTLDALGNWSSQSTDQQTTTRKLKPGS